MCDKILLKAQLVLFVPTQLSDYCGHIDHLCSLIPEIYNMKPNEQLCFLGIGDRSISTPNRKGNCEGVAKRRRQLSNEEEHPFIFSTLVLHHTETMRSSL